ncbi:probable inactive serine/threonine-protein kinase fnkC [Carica papaya]|uniref:probable inactive serine/threonine-protein kinase fnkC n=1 Tax=Carica papaya TaxID=3649 RepID=UPI000B8CBBF2|nr:probable inactive serine/threonine-protein kinase fnkC [Carica papaya]
MDTQLFEVKAVASEKEEEEEYFDHSDEEDYVYDDDSGHSLSGRDTIGSQTTTHGDHNLSDSRITDSYNNQVTQKYSYKYIHQMKSSNGLLGHIRDKPPRHYLLIINNFSSLLDLHVKKIESGVFTAGGYKWKLILYPNGNEKARVENCISFYLAMEDTTSLPPRFEVNVDLRVFVLEQLQKKFIAVQDSKRPIRVFNGSRLVLGFAKFISLENFKDENNGFLLEDSCTFGVEVFVAKSTREYDNLFVKDNLVQISRLKSKEYYTNGSMVLTTKTEQENLVALTSRDSSFQLDQNQGILRTIRDFPPDHIFEIKSFSSLRKDKIQRHEFNTFQTGGLNWRLCFYPEGCKERNGSGHISLYLEILKEGTFPSQWEVTVNFKMFVFDQIRNKYHIIQDADGVPKCFNGITKEWGFAHLVSQKTFNDPQSGFLVNDHCKFGVEIFVIKHMCNKNVMIKDPANCNTYTWLIDNFSTLNSRRHESMTFTICGRKWQLIVYPKGDTGVEADKWLSLFLSLVDAKSLPLKQEHHIKYNLRIRDQVTNNHCEKSLTSIFKYPSSTIWGYKRFISLLDLHDKSKGYICKDTLIIEVIFTSIVVHNVLLEI